MKKPAKSKKATKSAKRTEGAVKPAEETETANTSAPAAAPQVEEAPVLETPGPEPMTGATAQPEDKAAVLSARSEAGRRTATGKFTKVVFAQIGGGEVPNYAKLTWVQRDAINEKHPEVKAHYEAHLASVGK
jgi:hypothetical protein